ncbi:vitamin B12 dependent methionine synthase [Christensenellaceae bacterium OttesenSCG-928-K19]|nr:vitamin B12 dependent methionine synthase [Christensenellaceae bacterium OttesenSCG-928-K19]
MERFVLDDFSTNLNFDSVVKKLLVTEEEDLRIVRSLYEEALAIAKPKAVYKVCSVEEISGSRVRIGGAEFESAALAKNLEGIHRVFAYVTTCGTEVDDWSHREQDYFIGLWLDMIKELILHDTQKQFVERIQSQYHVKKTAAMNPGSGNADVWPIAQQRQLFDLIDGVEQDVGVTLKESFLMLPTKSVSGILFPSDKDYVNCALCTRADCPGRRAPYNPHIV